MPVLTIREIYDTARAAGFGEREAVTWTAIALARSGGRTGELNARGESDGGLWRIASIPGVDTRRWGDLEDPRNSARAAFEISRHGLDPGPWITAVAGSGNQTDYRTQLGKVEQEIGITGDSRGPAGNGAAPPPLTPGAPPSSYDQIDQGRAFGAEAQPWTPTGALSTIGGTAGDSDRDGLSDVFERLVGTDTARIDSDGDGLTDGYEANTGTDPLSTDTDRDGFTDGLEVGQRGNPLTADGSGTVPRWTIETGSQRRLAAMAAAPQPAQQAPVAQQPGPATEELPSPAPARDLNGGRVSSVGAEPKLVVSLDAAGHGNWQGAVKSGNHWFLAQAGAGDKFQVFHRLDANGNALDQMKVVGAAHATSFAVVGNTVYATNDGEVVTFPYQPGATIDASDSTPTGWKGYISIDPTNRLAVIRKGNHYRAYDLQTREPIGKEVITPKGQRQGFSIVGDALYVLTGKTNQPGRVDSFSFTTGQQTGTQDVTAVGPGRHREPEGMYGDLMGVKTGLGSARRLKIYQLDTGISPATEVPPVTDPTTAAALAAPAAADDGLGAGQHAEHAEPEAADNAGDDGDHVKFGGKTVDRRTAAMLTEAERLANVEDPSIGKFNLTQGSFSHSVGASAGTHDGPGAFDMYTRSYSSDQKETIGLALRKVGFASWLRRESQGPWDEHWHGIAIGTKGLPSVAAGQVKSYLDGGNGLRGNGRDTDQRPDEIRTWEEYRTEQGLQDGAPATTPVPPNQPAVDPNGNQFGIAPGQLLDPGRDSDADGLTDVFERLALTDAGRADSDGDGLLDGYEVGTSRSDPLLIDSDLDGFTDAAELRFGGNPLGASPMGAGQGADPLGSDPLGSDPAAAGGPQHGAGDLLGS
ncbi:MAG TPA: hypothetical protein VIT42_01320 [Microlunatus sp.]